MNLIGQGSYGSVYKVFLLFKIKLNKAQHLRSHVKVAVKMLEITQVFCLICFFKFLGWN